MRRRIDVYGQIRFDECVNGADPTATECFKKHFLPVLINSMKKMAPPRLSKASGVVSNPSYLNQ
ncbi:hypothetical protein KIN20_005592 [Parelaphostrongylus tenuis]|uniref:Uncharacterized protein n=1 Tax=Parelaphostrongylus tenuis TaxID=148309 RepID=A0AAD5QIP9_PARTN|nr:hypothetical protein KIN20_005592 [Parelaphostrongylus tenuis]